MVPRCLVVILSLWSLTHAAPHPENAEFWRGTALDSTVEKLRDSCVENDSFACIQFKAFAFLDNVLKGNYFQHVTVTRNGYENEIGSKRSDESLEEAVETFIKSNDVTFNLPMVGDLTVDSRQLDDDEIHFRLNFGREGVQGRGKKHKLKKVFIPIITMILLKVITVVPFIIGVLALKAWNGLQLSAFSFIIATGLAIFQLCQKLAVNSHAPVILEHPPVAKQKRSTDDYAQNLAYSGYNY